MKSKKETNELAEQMGEVAKYFTLKCYEIMDKTGLYLSKNSKQWAVNERKDYKTLKKGTFKQCMDFVLNKWKQIK